MGKSKARAPLTPGGEMDAVAKGTGAGLNWLMQLSQVAPNLPPDILQSIIDGARDAIPIAMRVMQKKLMDMDRGDERAREKIRFGEIAKPVVDLTLMLSTALGTRKQSATLSPEEMAKVKLDYEQLQGELRKLDQLEMQEQEKLAALEAQSRVEEVVEAEVVK